MLAMEPRLSFETANQYQQLRDALMHHHCDEGTEAGAFLFAEPTKDGDLRVVEIDALNPEDFVEQTAKYLELREEVLQAAIVRGHCTGTALVEAHTHPSSRGRRVRFSRLDCDGLKEVGPHVTWRLPNRPYVALVFGRDAFDSLYWESGQRMPQGAVDIRFPGRVLRPSRVTLRKWRLNHGSV